MADISWTDVTDLQPNLSAVSSGAQAIILEYVNNELNPGVFGGEDSARFHLARCFMAAHLGEIARSNGAGSVSSETIGTTSITLAYAAANSAGDALLKTPWGSQFAVLVRLSPLRVGGGRVR